LITSPHGISQPFTSFKRKAHRANPDIVLSVFHALPRQRNVVVEVRRILDVLSVLTGSLLQPGMRDCIRVLRIRVSASLLATATGKLRITLDAIVFIFHRLFQGGDSGCRFVFAVFGISATRTRLENVADFEFIAVGSITFGVQDLLQEQSYFLADQCRAMPLNTIFGLHLFWLSAFNLGSPEKGRDQPHAKSLLSIFPDVVDAQVVGFGTVTVKAQLKRL
jgi:hypothetical protein